MADQPTRNVLLPIDGSDNSQRAFDFYNEQIKKPGDTLILVHVQPATHLPSFSIHEPLTLPTEEWGKMIKEQIEKSRKCMEHYEISCEQLKIPKKTVLAHGKPGEIICDTAKEKNANIVVMGSRGLNGMRRTFLGSVSDYVIHHCHLPVLVVPPMPEAKKD